MVDVELFANLINEGATAGELDVINELCVPLLQALLPPGVAWSRDADAELTQLVRALSYEFSRVKRRGRDLLEEIDPNTTYELLEDFERVYGLPSECTQPTTLAGRRAALLAKMLGFGDPNESFFLQIAEELGYDDVELTTYDHTIPFTCESDCTYSCYEEWILFCWTMTMASQGAVKDAVLQCTIEGTAPSHTTPTFIFTTAEAGQPEVWLPRTSNAAATTNGTLHAVTYSEDRWVAVGQQANVGRIVGSFDGPTWESWPLPDCTLAQAVAYDPVKHTWVIGGVDGSSGRIIVLYPDSAGNYVNGQLPLVSGAIRGVAVGGDVGDGDGWVAVTEDGTIFNCLPGQANRGDPADQDSGWELAEEEIVDSLRAVATDGGTTFIAVGTRGGKAGYAKSADSGATWSDGDISAGDADAHGIVWDEAASLWVVVGGDSSNDAIIYTSPNGTVWTQRTAPVGVKTLRSVTVGADGVLCAVGGTDPSVVEIIISTNATAWTEATDIDAAINGPLYGIARRANDEAYVAVGQTNDGSGNNHFEIATAGI